MKPIKIGITGGFGTGKSTVAGEFKKPGILVIDADKLAKQAVSPGTPGWRKAGRVFGRSAMVDRKKLAKIVFGNRVLRRKLENIIHPQVIREIRKLVRNAEKSNRFKAVVIEVPLLFEAGLESFFDLVITVTADRRQQVRRIRKKTGMLLQEILQRIKAQMPIIRKVRRADIVIDNSGSVSATRSRVRKIIKHVMNS